VNNHKGSTQKFNLLAKHHFIDVIRLRLRRELRNSEIRFLNENSQGARLNRGNYIPDFITGVLTVNVPNRQALEFVASLSGAMVNYLEISVDLIFDQGEAERFHDWFNFHFVQPRHGKRESVFRVQGTTSYSGQRRRGNHFAWYSDRPSKASGEVDCFHLEGRHQGMEAVDKLGIEHPRDLLNFDHRTYCSKHLRLYEMDLSRLGRRHSNQRSRARRQKPRFCRHGGLVYDEDRAMGCVIFRHWSTHENQQQRSIQRFIDQYGRAPFLVRVSI
jgi:hypothetical protein